MEAQNNRSITLSTKVTAEQKAVFANIAAKNNISLSEWMASLLEIHKDSYDKIGDPTQREANLEIEVQKKENQIKRLKAQLDSADHKVRVEMKRADNAVTKKDEETLKLKKLKIENINLKSELNNAISKNAVDNEKRSIVTFNENKSLILPSIGLTSIIFGLVLGQRRPINIR